MWLGGQCWGLRRFVSGNWRLEIVVSSFGAVLRALPCVLDAVRLGLEEGGNALKV